jgi:hypothetical protein
MTKISPSDTLLIIFLLGYLAAIALGWVLRGAYERSKKNAENQD